MWLSLAFFLELAWHVWWEERKTIKHVLDGRIVGKKPIGRPKKMERCCEKIYNNYPAKYTIKKREWQRTMECINGGSDGPTGLS